VSNNEANVSGIDEKKFQERAEQTKKSLVSIAVADQQINLKQN